MNVATNPTTPMNPIAQRHDSTSATYDAMSRPVIPPSPLPPINSPIARPMELGCISSATYVIEIAGSPANVTPTAARMTSMPRQSVTNALATVSSADAKSDQTMIVFRPRTSENTPATIIAGARSAVVSESARLLCAALTRKSCAKTGRSGWTQ